MTITDSGITMEELRLAARNHGMPLEALRYDITPAGLHYLLIHYDIPAVDPDTWALEVDGAVRRPIRLDLDDLTALTPVTAPVTFECAGNGRALLLPRPVSQPWLHEAVGTAEWTGARLADVLAMAELDDDVVEVVFTGLDRGIDGGIEQAYQRSLRREDARDPDIMLAYAMNRQPLLPQHGYPLRLVVPGWYGMTNVKWLTRITAVTEPFDANQQVGSYRMRSDETDPGKPVERMLPRSLMVPPGIPDFLTRDRLVDAGPVDLTGRAWSGHGGITSVEVSTDGGGIWEEARLEPAPSPSSWHRWTHRWDAEPGPAVLCSRATDDTGRSQEMEPLWNLGGYQVNAVQQIRVQVG